MATSSSSSSSSSSLPQKRKNLYTLSTLSLLLLFLLCLFLFTKRALEPNLSLYRDLISLKPTPILLSPPRSTIPSENVDKNTSLSKSDSDDNVDEIADKPFSSNEKITGSISSKSNLDEKNSSKSHLDDKFDEPFSSNEEITGPISSKSNLDEKNSSKSNLDEENRGKLKNSPGDVVSSNGESGIGNAVAEKLRSCDIYNGKWVRDEDYPLYRPGSCPYVDGGFDCQSNGRPDFEYLKWRWKPDDCDLPRFWFF